MPGRMAMAFLQAEETRAKAPWQKGAGPIRECEEGQGHLEASELGDRRG